jgi:hypothetical protein
MLGVLIPVLGLAANVLIWEKDTLDIFYDGQIGATISTSYWVEQTLTQLGHAHATVTTLPSNLSSYDAVFVLLGWYRC